MEIIEKNKCTGCEACYNICPKNAINMVEDKEGFLYPQIDEKKCINCGMCKKICPNNKEMERNEEKSIVLAASNQDENIRWKSTSGGIFTMLAEKILEQNGIVYGAMFDSNFKVIHDKIETKEDIKKLRGSKYVQSRIGNIYKNIKQQLNDGKKVLFSGTPCQIAGLKSFLNKDYELLYCVEIFCKGVPSPKIWNSYLEYQEKRNKTKIEEIYFRKKTYGFHSTTLSMKFRNGKQYNKGHESDIMLKLFVNELISRPVCYNCNFRGMNRQADISIGDLWHADRIIKEYELDADKGVNIVLINTNKGKELFNSLSNIKSFEITLDKGLEQNANGKITAILNNPKQNINRNRFFEEYNKKGLLYALNICAQITYKDKIKAILKPVLYRTKILNKIKK